jgi:hypothetical protein
MAEHEKVWPTVSATGATAKQPIRLLMVDSGSVTFQLKLGAVVYQPEAAGAAGLIWKLTWGGVWSATVTTKLEVLLFPALSLTEQVTVFAPKGNVEPEAGLQLTPAADTSEMVSIAVGLK